MGIVRRCQPDERPIILAMVNDAAEALSGRDPRRLLANPLHIPREELDAEIAARIEFRGYEIVRSLVGVMGVQAVRDASLIRHTITLLPSAVQRVVNISEDNRSGSVDSTRRGAQAARGLRRRLHPVREASPNHLRDPWRLVRTGFKGRCSRPTKARSRGFVPV